MKASSLPATETPRERKGGLRGTLVALLVMLVMLVPLSASAGRPPSAASPGQGATGSGIGAGAFVFLFGKPSHPQAQPRAGVAALAPDALAGASYWRRF